MNIVHINNSYCLNFSLLFFRWSKKNLEEDAASCHLMITPPLKEGDPQRFEISGRPISGVSGSDFIKRADPFTEHSISSIYKILQVFIRILSNSAKQV
jgi:hypothetical protein